MMTDSFNQQTTGVVVWEATNSPFDVASPLGKTVTPGNTSPGTLSAVTTSSSIPLTGFFDHIQPTANSSTAVGVGAEVYPPPMSEIEFTKPELQVKSNCTAGDNDKGKKRKADQITTTVNNWLPTPNPPRSYYSKKKHGFYLDFSKAVLSAEQRHQYMVLMYELIVNRHSSTPCWSCGNVNCVGNIRLIHWQCLTKLTGFLRGTIYDQTWEEVTNSNHLRIQAHQHFCMMFDLEMSTSPPSECFLKQLAYIFPNPKDLPMDHELFDSNKYAIPLQAKLNAVNGGVSKETYLTEDKETENCHLHDVFTPEEVEKYKQGT